MGAASQLEAARLAQQGQLQRQREQLAYEGEQAGLGRSFNEYMAGLNQGYGLQNLAAQNYYNAQSIMIGNMLTEQSTRKDSIRYIIVS